MNYPQHLRTLATSELETWISRSLPTIVNRSLRTGLHGIWAKGDWAGLPAGPYILAANHHSWWDLYLIWRLRDRLKRTLTGFMDEETLEKFPFFRRQGVISSTEVRLALRRLARGDVLQIFPEGELRQAGQVQEVEAGLSFLAHKAWVPVYPLAFRVVMRGAERPEAFIVLGERLEAENLPTCFTTAVNKLLTDIDAVVTLSNPEVPPEGFEAWGVSARRFDERLAWLKKVWS
ncbi:lysophospholipid acyltransferase family protein [soil metagenome]